MWSLVAVAVAYRTDHDHDASHRDRDDHTDRAEHSAEHDADSHAIRKPAKLNGIGQGMSDKSPDAEPGWGGMAILLWPVLLYMKVKAWLHNRLHPTQQKESE